MSVLSIIVFAVIYTVFLACGFDFVSAALLAFGVDFAIGLLLIGLVALLRAPKRIANKVARRVYPAQLLLK